MISSKNRTPGLSLAVGKNEGGHQTARPSAMVGMPRKSVGSHSDALRSITGILAADATSLTMALLPMPGGPHTKADHRCESSVSKTVLSLDGFITLSYSYFLYRLSAG